MQPLVDALVAAVDLPDVADRRLPRRSAAMTIAIPVADVRTEALAVELGGARDDGAVRAAQDDLAPIDTSSPTKNRRLSNIFSNTSTVPRAWVAATTAIEVRSAGNAGQIPLDSETQSPTSSPQGDHHQRQSEQQRSPRTAITDQYQLTRELPVRTSRLLMPPRRSRSDRRFSAAPADPVVLAGVDRIGWRNAGRQRSLGALLLGGVGGAMFGRAIPSSASYWSPRRS